MSQMVADYRILGPAATGSTGTFLYAEPPPRLGRSDARVLLKVVPGITDDSTFRRVSRELRVFAAVESTHLVQLLDAGQDGDVFYYSMEDLALGSLARPARPLRRHEVLRAVRDAALAAHDLHEAGLAHRDIQPATVMLHETGAKLADLGLAQTINPDQTITGLSQLESVEYVDPEVLYGGRATRAADVFSLGATLHRALTGAGLYGYLPAGEPLVAIRKVLTVTPTLGEQLEPDERAVIERCIAPAVDERFATAADVATAIDGVLAGVAPDATTGGPT